MIRTFLFAFLLLTTGEMSAQGSNEQLWLDYVLDHPFGGKYLAEVEASYQTLLSKHDKWSSLNLSPTFEYNALPYLDLMAGVPFSYTIQTSNYNSFETRLMLGTRLYFTPGKRVETRATIRYEHRMFKTIGIDTWDISNRIRTRAELIVPINARTYYNDKMWYGVLDVEVFTVFDGNVKERFANRMRTRIGLGYRLSYTWRFEFNYMAQVSYNEYSVADDDTYDTILRFRVKHYLNKSRPASKEGLSGN